MNTKSFLALVCAAVLTTALLHAQAPSVAPVNANGGELVGTMTDYKPGTSLTLQTVTVDNPIKFKLTKSTTYSDSNGKPVEATNLPTKSKVRVQYRKTDADNVVDKITVLGD